MGFGYAAASDSLFGTPANEILNIGRSHACLGWLHLECPNRLAPALELGHQMQNCVYASLLPCPRMAWNCPQLWVLICVCLIFFKAVLNSVLKQTHLLLAKRDESCRDRNGGFCRGLAAWLFKLCLCRILDLASFHLKHSSPEAVTTLPLSFYSGCQRLRAQS